MLAVRKGGVICTLGWFAFIAGFLLPIFPGIILIIAGMLIVMSGHDKLYKQGYRDGFGDGKGWTNREDREPGYKK